MDLTHDWKALNEVLFQQGNMANASSSLVLLEDDESVIDGVVSDGKAFLDRGLKGASSNKELLDNLASRYGAEQTMVLSKKLLDQCVIDAAHLGTNYFQQLQTIREKALEQGDRKKAGLIVSRRHFLLDLFSGKLRRALPRKFNVVLFVDQRPVHGVGTTPFSYRAILLSYAGGQLDQFFEPDFSSLHENRLINWHNEHEAIGQYLETRYMLPCYGLFMHQEEWERCLEAANLKRKPWKQFVRFYDEGHAAVYPSNFTTKSLLASQRLMVYFSRL